MLLEEFVAPVVFHWVTWRNMWLLPRFLHSNPWRRPLPLVCLARRLRSHRWAQANKKKRQRLMQFLRAYRSCFAFSMRELGVLIGLGIWIELVSDTPIFPINTMIWRGT
jgi:hypothetical protein